MVLFDNETNIRITNEGRLYLLNEATYIIHAGDGILHKMAFVGGTEPIKRKVVTEVRFKSRLKLSQEKILRTELKEQGISSTPAQIIFFLKGDNIVRFKIEKPHHIAYLLSQLLDKGLIEFVGGNRAFSHFESAISQDGTTLGKVGLSEKKRQVINPKYGKRSIQQEVDSIITRLLSK